MHATIPALRLSAKDRAVRKYIVPQTTTVNYRSETMLRLRSAQVSAVRPSPRAM
jgi:hypothetical protein